MPRLPKGLFRRKGRSGIYLRDRRGGKDRWRKAGDTKDEAVQFRDRLRGSSVPIRRITVGEAAKLWLERAIATSRNETGQRLARQRVERELVPVLGMRPIATLTADDCREYRLALEASTKRSGETRSPQTIAHILSDLRCLLAWAEEAKLVDRSPFPRRLLPRVQELAPKHLAAEEVSLLVTLPEPWGFYLRFLLGTGLRWSEATRAEASHVERGWLVVAQTKSGKVRRVPLEPSLLAEIGRRIGRLVPVENAQTLALRAREVVPGFHVHRTRHTFAHRWLEEGGSLETLQPVLGHSTIRTTQRYGRPSEESIRREGAKGWG